MLDHLAGLAAEAARFHGAVTELGSPVPSCPSWNVGELIHHVGTVHRTFGRVAGEGWMRRPPDPDPDPRPAPDDPAVVAWARERSQELVAHLATLAPDAPRWNFSAGPQIGAFIPRRMHHETAIHRWDLEGATSQPGPLDPEAAADGAQEYLEVFLPRSGDWPAAAATVLVVVDERPVTVELVPGERPTLVLGRPRVRPDLEIAGSGTELFLALWGRAPLDAHRRAGSGRLLEQLIGFGYH